MQSQSQSKYCYLLYMNTVFNLAITSKDLLSFTISYNKLSLKY